MEDNRKRVNIYTDGACSGNPGPGGWAAILEFGPHRKELSGFMAGTTNNRMELLGVIKGFEALKFPCEVKVVSDSKYVVDAFREHWVDSWVKHDFRKADKKKVKNVDLWKRLLEAMKPHSVTFEWVKGHDGHPENERCDDLAQTAADSDDLLIDEGMKGEEDEC